MSATTSARLTTTVAREFVLALAGVGLVLFIFMHLSGNLLIYAGPEHFNAYSAKLHELGALLWVARIGLIAAFGAHAALGLDLALRNRRARKNRYAEYTYMSDKTLATRTMAISGLLIFFFIWIHLYDFTLSDHSGSYSIVDGMNDGASLGLYGVVFNTFSNPLHALFYIVVMVALGMHLSHALSSVFVTLGSENSPFVSRMETVAKAVATLVSLGFISIPIYILVRAHLAG
ncbi:MAG: succinate dehydrogenase cytochrome b subunit [Candidatus Hydrogenedentes bacterium]|nr:succinate dehydrogenase cytochrome b subunit [Candidatus Hydrogenedentota bacterium]